MQAVLVFVHSKSSAIQQAYVCTEVKSFALIFQDYQLVSSLTLKYVQYYFSDLSQ